MQCSICLDDLDASGPTLACGHRFHAACLARLAGANGTTPTRRGALTACPNCRTTSRVAPMTSAAFSVGDRVLALWGHKWFPGDVYNYDQFTSMSSSQLRSAMQSRGVGRGAYDTPVDFRRKLRAYEAKRPREEDDERPGTARPRRVPRGEEAACGTEVPLSD